MALPSPEVTPMPCCLFQSSKSAGASPSAVRPMKLPAIVLPPPVFSSIPFEKTKSFVGGPGGSNRSWRL
jgi:hypothetical protein